MTNDNSDDSVSVALTHEPASNRARILRPRRIISLTLVLFCLLLTGDWYQKNREMNELVTAVEHSESKIIAARDNIYQVLEPYAKSVSLDNYQREQARRLVREAAARGAEGVIVAGDAVEDVFVMPWHTAIIRAKARYIAHSTAWKRHLVAVAKEPSEFAKPEPTINATFESAYPAFKAATPRWSLYNLRTRIDEVFAGAIDTSSSS